MPTSFARFSTTPEESATPLPRPEYGALRAVRAVCGRNRRSAVQRRLAQGSAAESGAARTGVEQVSDADAERVLLLVGTRRRRFQSRRNARHRRGSVLLPRARVHDGARDLHRRDHRSGNAVLQRPAVRLRLHGRRMARRPELGVPAAGDSLRQSRKGSRGGGIPTPSPIACRASSCCSKTWMPTASSSSSSRTARTSSSTRSPIPANPDGDVDEARDQRTRPVGEPWHGRRRYQRRRARRFPECVRLVGAACGMPAAAQSVQSGRGRIIRRRSASGRDRARAAPRWRCMTSTATASTTSSRRCRRTAGAVVVRAEESG